MRIPKELQHFIDALDEYQVDDSMKAFHILHMYPQNKLSFPNGYPDTRQFSIWVFNREKMTKRYLGRGHDDILISRDVQVESVMLFLDGATVIRFRELVMFLNGQAIFIEPIEKHPIFLIKLSKFFRRLAS